MISFAGLVRPTTARNCTWRFDGVDKTGTLQVVNTGDWQNYTNLIKKNVRLEAGVHKLKVVIENSGFNLNYVEVLTFEVTKFYRLVIRRARFDFVGDVLNFVVAEVAKIRGS